MRAYERFLNYVKVATESDDRSNTNPTTEKQFDLARLLASELVSLGVKNAYCDEKCYVYASLEATPGCENAPRVGFIAHVDTSPDFSGTGVKPRVIENYDGGEVSLGDSGRVLSPTEHPHLKDLVGRTLIVTDGTTLLGADDKSGVAEIMTLIENIINNPIPHGKISVCFTPDEEVGSGADNFDLEAFGADFAYTLDGEVEGELVFENFNASAAVVDFNGVNIHPGSAKNLMKNAALMAMEFNSMLPSGDVPSKTEEYEGFFHLTDMSGCVESARLEYIIRDHDESSYKARLALIRHAEKVMIEKYGKGSVKLTLREQYRNMKECILPVYYIIDIADEATRTAGLTPVVRGIRGGTDGARLSFMGLPCPNLGTGGYAFHGPYEHITAEGMDKCVEIIENIVKLCATKNRHGE